MRRLIVLLALVVAVTACGEDFFDPTPGQKGQATGAELIGRHIRLVPGAGSAFRVAFRPKDPSVRVRIERSSAAGRVIACPLKTIDDPLPAESSCKADLPDGVRESFSIGDLGAIALVREGDPIMIDLVLDYEEGGRSFQIRMPSVPVPPGPAACKDNACNPFFELEPLHGGRFTATATWASGNAKLELLEGRVKARAFSSTGIPYRIAATETGPSPLTIGAQLNAPSEYALTLVNVGSVELRSIRIDVGWP